MSENKNNIPTENEGEELDNILTLNDEEGNEVEFEFLDLIEYDGELHYKPGRWKEAKNKFNSILITDNIKSEFAKQHKIKLRNFLIRN